MSTRAKQQRAKPEQKLVEMRSDLRLLLASRTLMLLGSVGACVFLLLVPIYGLPTGPTGWAIFLYDSAIVIVVFAQGLMLKRGWAKGKKRPEHIPEIFEATMMKVAVGGGGLLIALMTSQLLFILGTDRKLGFWLYHVLSPAANRAVNTFVVLVNWAISGVIGCLAYDILKRIVRSFVSRIRPE